MFAVLLFQHNFSWTCCFAHWEVKVQNRTYIGTVATSLQLYPIRVCVPVQKCLARHSTQVAKWWVTVTCNNIVLQTMESFYPSPTLMHVWKYIFLMKCILSNKPSGLFGPSTPNKNWQYFQSSQHCFTYILQLLSCERMCLDHTGTISDSPLS